MRYDFDTVFDRRGSGSIKWDVAENELPMWVADMDFKACPDIVEALERRVAHGIFGYSDVREEWYSAISDWWRDRHGFTIDREWLMFCTGVVPAISSTVRKLTSVGENVLIQTPVYNIFYNCIRNNGRNVSENRLIYENGKYRIDFEALEKQLADPQTTLMLLCNPQNPAGNIWNRKTLRRIGDMCIKNGVTVLSDEIHCDLTDPSYEYIPFASVSESCRENCVACIAPTKTFNLAGLQTAAIYVPNPRLRHKVWRGINTDEVAEPNAFAIDAAVAAFRHGGEWLDELREYLYENKKTVKKYVETELPSIKVTESHATYLMWIDISEITDNSADLTDFLRERTGLFVNSGDHYGGNGNYFFRLNVACPRAVLLDGLERLKKGITEYNKQM